MKRTFLTGLGITDGDVIKQIIDFHQGVVQDLKDDLTIAKGELTTVKTDLKTAHTDLKKAQEQSSQQDDGEDWKSKHDTLKTKYDTDIAAKQKEYDDFKASTETEKTTAAKQTILRKQLTADGANAKLVDLLELKFDLANIELDGDKIKDWDNISKPIKEQYADVFTLTEQRGFEPGNPPANNNGKIDYKSQLESARKTGNTQEAVKIKTEAAKEGVILI